MIQPPSHNPPPAPERGDELERLLDEALGVEAIQSDIPAQMENRILAATLPRLQHRPRNILARIGPWRGLALAASVALAVSLGWWARQEQPQNEIQPAQAFAHIEQGIQAVTAYKGPSALIDQEMMLLAVQIDQTSTARDWDKMRQSVEDTREWSLEAEAMDETTYF